VEARLADQVDQLTVVTEEDEMPEMNENCGGHAQELAEAHVDWFLKMLKPLLVEFMKHGYKHGLQRGLQLKDDERDKDA